jgi:hypothetical protein
MKYRCYRKNTAIVILMSFLTVFRVSGEPPTMPPTALEESGMKRYSGSEVDKLIEELSEAAEEAIERAAAEAAKAAVLAGLEREAEALREMKRWKNEAERLKQAQVKNYVLTGVICFLGGLVIGITINR